MKTKKISNLVIQNIIILIPFILYGIYKNGYLIFERNLINFSNIFKPLYLILISVAIKIIFDLVKYHKIKIDFNFVYCLLISMIMPYNINYLVFTFSFLILYILSNFLEKYCKFNKVCLIYLGIILINSIFNEFTFQNILESKYSYSFNFWDLLMGRNIGGIASSSIFFSLIIYVLLINNIYYKKDIPYAINITYLLLMIGYFLITKNSSNILNSELIFGSILVSTNPESSPFKIINQILYGILIGTLAFFITIIFNGVIAVYLATFMASLLTNIRIRQNSTKQIVASEGHIVL